MAAPGSSDAKKLVESSISVLQARPWSVVDAGRAIVFEVPTEPTPLFAFIHGSAGYEPGVSVWRGERAAAHAQAAETMATGAAPDFESLDILSLSFQRLSSIPPQFRKLLLESGLQFTRDDLAPTIYVKRPGRQPRPPNATERKTLLYVLNALRVAQSRSELRKVRSTPARLILTATGSARNPTVEVSIDVRDPGAMPAPESVVAVPEDLAAWPRLDEGWVVGWPEIPTTVEGDDRSVSLLVVGERDSGRAVGMSPVFGRDLAEAAKELFRIFAGKSTRSHRALPRSIVFLDQRLFDAVAPSLAAIGVGCSMAASDPLVDHLLDGFLERLESSWPEPDDESVPAPGDLEAWKRVDREFMERLAGEITRSDWGSAEAIATYFGSADAGRTLLRKYIDWSVIGAFREWVAVDYRRTERGPTVLERLLRSSVPGALRRAANAHRSAVPSIWRVDAVEPGATITMTDLIAGTRRTVHDRELSKCVRPGMGFPCRVLEFGDFYFPTTYGPPLSAIQLPRALDFLERTGLELSTEGLRRNPELLGRLWQWADGEGARLLERPTVTNTDGDPLELRRAVFRIEDPASFREALAARKGIDSDPEKDVYVWYRRNAKTSSSPGTTTVLGRLQIVGDRVVVEVNSRNRLAKARKWLEAMPKVRFETMQMVPLDNPESTALDDRLPDAEPLVPTPDLIAGLQEYLEDYYLRWLDAPIPALGGQTPRDAVKTEAGRRAVRRMILMMSDPSGVPGVSAPRDMLFRQLGLDRTESPGT